MTNTERGMFATNRIPFDAVVSAKLLPKHLGNKSELNVSIVHLVVHLLGYNPSVAEAS